MDKICIGADIVPTQSNLKLFVNAETETLIGKELQKILREASYRIFNLEVPLTDKIDPIVKKGPNLVATTKTINGFSALGINLLTLANNHILDQGSNGLSETERVLDEAQIAHVGAGSNIKEASIPYVFSCFSKSIGVYACAEHEYSIAEKDRPGANPFDSLSSFDQVEKLKRRTDYVIVLFHGGKEHYRFPSPNLQKICRQFIDKGADLVICQHSHCIGCEEIYNNGTIVYGQGNFIFDDCDDELWKTSLLIVIDNQFNISYLPIIKTGNTVRLADAEEANSIMEGFKKRSEQIRTDGFIELCYKDYADKMLSEYLLNIYSEESFAFRLINKISGNILRRRIIQKRTKEKQLTILRNLFECESHRELLLEGIKNKLNK